MPAYVEDTIAAIATAEGPGAVAVVRVSGRDAVQIASRVLRPLRRGGRLDLSTSHRARRVALEDPEGGGAVDDVLVLPMLAPHSYTGEDVVEIHCHGGSVLPRLALRALLRSGARAARPGEFTERAFLNGRLDLCQAEAVADLVASRSEASARLAHQQLGGVLSRAIADLRERVLDARALAEAHLDFPEDDVPPETYDELVGTVTACCRAVEALAATYERGRLARDGVRVVLVGKPNVGKSSLLNAILGCERALVSDSPGTTRDYLEEPAVIASLAALLCDTAGLRPTDEAVEQAGIARTRARIEAADVAVVVLDGSKPLDDLDVAVLDATADCRARVIVRNKSDLPPAWRTADARPRAIADGGAAPAAEVSALHGAGIDALCRTIRDALPEPELESADGRATVTHERHHAALVRSLARLRAARAELHAAGCRIEIVGLELQSASAELEAIVGITTSEDVLGRVFARFCIGK